MRYATGRGLDVPPELAPDPPGLVVVTFPVLKLNDGILIECTEWLAPRTAEPITTDTMPSTASRQTQLLPRPRPYADRKETAGFSYVRLDDVGGGEVELATGVEVTEFVGPEPCGAPDGCVGASAPSPSSGRLTGLL